MKDEITLTLFDIYNAIGTDLLPGVTERELEIANRAATYALEQMERTSIILGICYRWHNGQTSMISENPQDVEPYAEHPNRVAATVREYGGSFAQVNAALCHDLLEDTRIPLLELQQDLTPYEIVLVQQLTHNNVTGETRAERFVSKLRWDLQLSVPAYLIRMADSLDNIQRAGFLGLDFARFYICEKYLQARTLREHFKNFELPELTRKLESVLAITLEHIADELCEDKVMWDQIVAKYEKEMEAL